MDQLNIGELQSSLNSYGIFLSDAKVAALATTIDADGDGSVTIEEFLTYIREEEGRLLEVWRQIDSDCGGTLDKEELRVLMNQMGKTISERRLGRVFREIDKDGSGEIEYEEFIEWWRNITIKVGGEEADDDDFMDDSDRIIESIARYVPPPPPSDFAGQPAAAQEDAPELDSKGEADLPKLHPEPDYFRLHLRRAKAKMQETMARDIEQVRHFHEDLLSPFHQILQVPPHPTHTPPAPTAPLAHCGC